MTSSSPEPAVRSAGGGTRLTGAQAAEAPLALAGRELRSGAWTRLGDNAVLGDAVTEHALAGLAEQAQLAARAQGYSTGWAEGRRAAEEHADELRRELLVQHHAEEARRDTEHQVAVDALSRAADDLAAALASACDQVAAHTTQVALDLTEELLGHELAVASAPGTDAVRRALDLVPADSVVRVRLCPSEAADPTLAALVGAVSVIADPSLQRGDAMVETVDGVVDARVSGAMTRVREVLAS